MLSSIFLRNQYYPLKKYSRTWVLLNLDVGQKQGALTVIDKARTSRETLWWYCQCKCGEIRTVEERRLVKGMISICIKCEAKSKMENQ
jgi:predicted SprT family Zn-dependent metalloprotease